MSNIITAVRLRDFQKHKSLDINFSPGINSIVGATDKGKSAVYRALRFALENDFKRVRFLRNGAKQTTVEVDIGNTTITRIKGKSKNVYIVGDTELKAFGTNCPDEVKQATGLTELNWSPQHGPNSVFLLAETSGNIAKQINQIISLDTIDKSIAFLGKKEKTYGQEIKATESQIATLVSELAELDYLDDAEQFLDRLEGAVLMSQDIQRKSDTVASMLNRLPDESNLEIDLDVVSFALSDIRALINENQTDNAQTLSVHRSLLRMPVSGVELDFQILESALARLRLETGKTIEMEKSIGRLSCLISRLPDGVEYDWTVVGAELTSLRQEAWDIQQLEAQVVRASDLLAKVDTTDTTGISDRIASLQEKLTADKAEHARLKGYCPKCGQKLPEAE